MIKQKVLIVNYHIPWGGLGQFTLSLADSSSTFNTQGYTGAPVIIGNNVWVADRVIIGQGVHIGDNVVIGANTVVTKSIPSHSIVHAKTQLVIKKNHDTF